MLRSKSRFHAIALLTLLASGSLGLTGCSPESRPVARVGKHTLTVGDFERAARRSTSVVGLPADQGRAIVLDQMVRNELMLVSAESHGLDTNTYTRQHRRTSTEQALLTALSAQLAPQDPGVTEAELREFYQWSKTQSDVQLVFAPDSSMITLALRQIQAGEPVETVADRFGGFGMLPPGGKVGYRRPGSLPQPVDDAARTLPVGRLGGPYRASMGWFLVRVLHRGPAPAAPFEQQRASLETLLRRRKWQAALLAGIAQLAPGYHLVLSDAAGPTLFRFLSPGRVAGLTASVPTASERAQVLSAWDGGTYTLGDAWDELSRPEISKPNANQVVSLREWVRERSVTRLALVEAKRRHLDEDPAIAGPLAEGIQDYILRGEYEDAVEGIEPPDDATLRATWEPLKDQYPMLHDAHVVWVAEPDTAKAMAIFQAASQGKLSDVVRAVDPALSIHEETLHFPTTDARWASAQSALQRLQPGQLAAPEATPEGFRMLQLLDGVSGPVSFDQLPQEVRQSLAGTLLQRAREARIAAYTDSLKRVVQPVLIPDALRGVPWPVPAASAP